MKANYKQPKKWALSALLIAALGSQYYFSISSDKLTSIDMSSEAPKSDEQIKAEQLSEKIRELNRFIANSPTKTELDKKNLENLKTEKKKTEVELKKVQEKINVNLEEKTETEGTQTYQVYCSTCSEGDKWVRITNVTKDSILSIAEALNKKTEPVAVKPEKKDDEVVFETASERRKRIKEEKEQAKHDAKEAKDAKLQEEKEARNDEFNDKVDAIVERCQDDLDCRVSRFSSLVSRYTGKKKIDMFVINKAYKSLIDKEIKSGLRGEDGSEGKVAALQAIENLTANLPSEYKSLKTQVIDSAKYAQIAQAQTVNTMIRSQDVQTKANGLYAADLFKQDANSIYQSMYEGITASKDQSAMDYVRNNYLPDMNKILSQLYSNTGLSQLAQQGLSNGTNTINSGLNNTANGARGGRGGNVTNSQIGAQSNNGNVGSGTIGNGSINFGPQRATPQGGRLGTAVRQ